MSRDRHATSRRRAERLFRAIGALPPEHVHDVLEVLPIALASPGARGGTWDEVRLVQRVYPRPSGGLVAVVLRARLRPLARRRFLGGLSPSRAESC